MVMTTNTELAHARREIEAAQTRHEQARADVDALDTLIAHLSSTIERFHELDAFSRGAGPRYTATVHAGDPDAVTPPVVNEDAVWELGTDLDERLQRLLRVVTAELTSGLDSPGC